MTEIGFPLSAQQRRAWAGELTCAQAVIALAAPAAGDAALKAALDRVVARHDALRTTFQIVDGLKFPLQIVHAALPAAWTVHDGGLAASCAAERRPFARDASPLRAAAMRAGDQRFLILTVSALCGDAGTLQQIVRELAAGLGGAPASEDPPQYLQLAAWQDSLLESEDAAAGAAVWRERSAAADAQVARLAFDGDRVADPAPSSIEVERVVSGDAWARLTAVAGALQVDARTLVLAAWHEVLRRFTGSDAAASWLVLDGRDGAGDGDAAGEGEALAGLCGPLATAVPLAAPALPGRPLAAVAAALAAALAVATEWQPYYRPDLDPAVACAGLGFGFEYATRAAPPACGTIVRLIPAVPAGELRLVCTASPDHLQLSCICDPARFAAPYVAAMLDAVVASCGGLDAARPVTASTPAPAPAHATPSAPPAGVLHQRFAAQAARTPDRIAVRCEHQALRFAELDRAANRLANRLRALGARGEEPIAICLERSSQLLVAILGILKAGGAYLPLHAGYPAARLRYILDETGARFVVAQRALADHAAFAGRTVIALDDPDALAGAGDHDPGVACTADQLAYIIYTSGSTGTPKGVEISHAAVANLLHALRARIYAPLTAAHGPLTVSLNAPIVFDASVKQWIQVLDGHTLHVIPEALRVDPAGLRALIAGAGIDVLDATPSLLRPLLAEPAPREPRAVLVGGEPVDPALWRAMAARHATAGTRFFNVYGPTECTVDATVAEVTAEGPPTIGGAIDHVQVHVLDAEHRPLPIGAPGELYIGGAGVARGYRRRPALTAERFVPDAASGATGGRLYRTGDRVWRRATGELIYLGRGDGQIKLRGYRIELGEIAAALREAPEVRDAVVVVAGAPGDEQLIGYVIPHDGWALGRERLRAQLAHRLPDYMVPAAFVAVARWPLTANGKLDVAALAAGGGELRAAEPATGGGPLLAGTTQRTIAAIWQDVLGVDRVGPDDNFFDLGGHSLRMVKVHARLREAFGRDIPMVELFRHPTIAALAHYFDRHPADDRTPEPTSQSGASAARGQRRISAVTSSSNRKRKRNP